MKHAARMSCPNEEQRVRQRGEERQKERDHTDENGWAKLRSENFRIDLCTGEVGKHDAPKAGNEIDPNRRVEADQVTGKDADEYLDKRGGEPGSGRNKRRYRRENHP